MKVYITYFRYDRGEIYSIYNLKTSLKRSLKHWYEEDVPNFLGYGPDDISQLYLVKCSLTKTEVEILKNFMSSKKDYEKDFYDLMKRVHDNSEELCFTTGDEVWEVLEYFYEKFRCFINPDDYFTTVPTDEDELKEELQEILFNDDVLWDKVLRHYISGY